MKRHSAIVLAIMLGLLFNAGAAAGLDGKSLVLLKRAGVSDATLKVIVEEKVIETAALSVDEIVALKRAGVAEDTLRLIIREGSFLKDRSPVVYGEDLQEIRFASVKDIIKLKNAGLSDDVIKAVIAVVQSEDCLQRERAWQMLNNMGLRVFVRAGKNSSPPAEPAP